MNSELLNFLRKRWYWVIALLLFLGVAYLNKIEDTKNAEEPHVGDIFFFKSSSDKVNMPYQVASYDKDNIYFYVSNFIKFDVNHIRDYNFDHTQFNHSKVIALSRKEIEAGNEKNIFAIPVVTKLRKE